MASGGNKTPAPPSSTPAIQAVGQQSLYEKLAEAKLKKFSDWENAPGAHDILEAPGMSDMLDIYGSAESLANQDRLASPAHALSGAGSGDYAAQADELGKSQRYNERAAGLSHALQSTKDEAYGMGGSAAELEFRRKQAMAQDQISAESEYYRRPQKKPLWERIAGLAIGGLGAAGGLGPIGALFGGGGGSRGGGGGG